MNVGFIGLGRMGAPMARNLIKAGHTLTVYNRTRHRAEPLQSAGAKIASSPADAAAGAEDVSVPMPLASLVHDRFVSALAQGLGESDWAAFAHIAYRNAGLGDGAH